MKKFREADGKRREAMICIDEGYSGRPRRVRKWRKIGQQQTVIREGKRVKGKRRAAWTNGSGYKERGAKRSSCRRGREKVVGKNKESLK